MIWSEEIPSEPGDYLWLSQSWYDGPWRCCGTCYIYEITDDQKIGEDSEILVPGKLAVGFLGDSTSSFVRPNYKNGFIQTIEYWCKTEFPDC